MSTAPESDLSGARTLADTSPQAYMGCFEPCVTAVQVELAANRAYAPSNLIAFLVRSKPRMLRTRLKL